ncbi:MAG: leucyl aminopeptidase [Acidobacteriia bacterium]|nr:leucyl aminopeptidase [Terriglobia bacterium]
MKFDLTPKKFSELQVEALVVYVFEKETELKGTIRDVDRVTGGLITSLLSTKELTGKPFEYAYARNPEGLQAKRIFVFGAGKKETFDLGQLRKLAGAIARTLRSKSILNFALLKRSAFDSAGAAQAVVEGIILAHFDIDRYKTDNEPKNPIQTVLLAGGDQARKPAILQAIERGRIVAEAQNFARELINEPSNKLTPTHLAERASVMAREFDLRIEILEREDMEKLGMGALLSVARGSEEPPKLIVLTYDPQGVEHPSKTIGLVGKGITFDTGGISLKPPEGMEKMKYDMSGAASMIAVMRALALLKPKVKVIAMVPTTENMPGGRAQKPGDVQTSMSGKTIEVINTDAEGRLVLSDAIAYVKKLGATHLIDMATLTGAVSIALGDVRVGVMGNHQKWMNAFLRAAEECGEKMWQLPMDEEYGDLIKSKIADLKNTGGRYASTITAAKFLEVFAGDTPWIHLDIAGTEWLEEAKPYCSEGPTGIGIRSVIQTVCTQR